MLKKIVLCFLLFLPNITFALSCASSPIADFVAATQTGLIVTFKVIGTVPQATEYVNELLLDVEVTEEFMTSKINNARIQIDFNPGSFEMNVNPFPENSEWLAVIHEHEKSFSVALCSAELQVKDGIIIGKTGLNILDNSESKITIDKFRVAINAFKQAIDLANKVCSINANCEHIKASYIPETGELDLPVIKLVNAEYNGLTGRLQPESPIDYNDLSSILEGRETSSYVDAKLQKTSDNPATFILKKVEPTWGVKTPLGAGNK